MQTNLLGTGPRRVVVLHDWLCDTSTWAPARPYLDTETFTWAFADLRGYGAGRDGGPATFTVEEAAGDVLAAADRLGWGRFSIVGHSMSTIVALHVAQTSAARVERVVLTTPPPPKGFGYDAATHARLQEVARGDDAQRARALAFMLGDRLGPEWLRFKLARWRETSDPDAVAAYVALFGVTGLPDTTTPVACPVLAIAGEQDAPPMRSRAVLAALTPLCPSLTVAPLADVGHYPMQEAPPLFAALVQRFLRAQA